MFALEMMRRAFIFSYIYVASYTELMYLCMHTYLNYHKWRRYWLQHGKLAGLVADTQLSNDQTLQLGLQRQLHRSVLLPFIIFMYYSHLQTATYSEALSRER